VTGGTLGSLRFAAAASWVGTVLSWWHLRQALQDSDSIGVPRWLWPSLSAGSHRKSAKH
jgi:hypothetical protein